jgi:hypothetical protein
MKLIGLIDTISNDPSIHQRLPSYAQETPQLCFMLCHTYGQSLVGKLTPNLLPLIEETTPTIVVFMSQLVCVFGGWNNHQSPSPPPPQTTRAEETYHSCVSF